jgi:signal transduction histidine kinase
MTRQSAADPFRQQTAFVHLLQVVAVTANEAATVEDAMQRCLDQVCGQTGWPVGHAYLLADDGTGALVPTTLWHLDTPERFATFRQVTEALRLPPGMGLPGRVLASGKPAWIMDISQEPQAPRARHAQDSGLKAAFAFPVLVGRDVAAVLEFFAAEAHPPDAPLLDVMAHIGTQLGRVMERTRAEAALRQQTQMLGERVKELQCLYAIAALVAQPGIALEALCQGIVEVMPLAWQYPDITCGRVVLDHRTFATPNFQHTRWQLTSDIQIDGERLGTVEIYYLEEKPDSAAGPFLHEEQRLLNVIAEFLGETLERRRVEDERARYAAQLQALSQRLLDVQETERRAIARELHDEIGQLLTGLKLTLEMRAPLLGEEAKEHLHHARRLVHDLMARVRHLSLDLRPTMLDDLGVLPALLWHVERFTAQTSVQVDFKHAGLDGRRFGPAVETAAFRIVQEALTNVARHAGVKHVTVRSWADHETLHVLVEDQGTGFEPQRIPATSHGLTGMRERASALGGQLTIDAAPGVGTCILAALPLRSTAGVPPPSSGCSGHKETL